MRKVNLLTKSSEDWVTVVLSDFDVLLLIILTANEKPQQQP